jgi:hypothetical protein
MKFVLEIELGNDAMQHWAHVRKAIAGAIDPIRLSRNAANLNRPHPGDGGKIMDVNGNSVGQWAVTEDTPLETSPEPATIDFTPPGLKTPQGCTRTDTAIDAFNATAHAVANNAKDLLRARANGTVTGYDWEEIETAVKARDAAQEEFLRARRRRPARKIIRFNFWLGRAVSSGACPIFSQREIQTMRTKPAHILPGCPYCNADHNPDNECRFKPVSVRGHLKPKPAKKPRKRHD